MHFGELNMFNKNRILTTAICASALIGSTYSATSVAATANGSATAVVIAPLTIVETPATTMDFGTITDGGVGGTVTIDPAGAITVVGATQSGATSAASFDVTGQPATVYTVTYGPGTLSDGANTMAIVPNSDNSLGAIPGGGTETFNVGAQLSISLAQPGGTYTTALGTPYTVNINY